MRLPRKFIFGLVTSLSITLGLVTSAWAADVTSAPNYTISGGATGLVSPLYVVQDRSGGTYVGSANENYVRYFAPGVQGNVQPTRVISGAATGLNVPYGLAIDESGLLYVANYSGNEITVYSPTADGNVAPLYRWTLQGSSSGPRGIAFEPLTGNLAVSSDANVQFYSGAASNAPVLQRSLVDNTVSYRQSIAFGETADFYIADFAGAVRHYAAGASGAQAPDRTITGASTGLDQVWSVQVQPVTGDIYVSADAAPRAVLVFPSNANGNVAPADRYIGGDTGISGPKGVYLACNDFIVSDGTGALLNFSTIESVACPTPSPAPAPEPREPSLANTGTLDEHNWRLASVALVSLLLGVGLMGRMKRGKSMQSAQQRCNYLADRETDPLQ